MNICIIVHSQTGNTLQFAKLLFEKLKTRGNNVDIVELRTDKPVIAGSVKHPPQFKITNLPDISNYDAIIAGGPVWSFSASPVIYKAITELSPLKGRKFIPFVTMSAPLVSMGGTDALKLMNEAAANLGAELLPGVALPRLFNNIDTAMKREVEMICLELK
jgi:NAD(P)H dehydrogenase (quinone)